MIVESIKKLCNRQGITLTHLEKKLGFGRGSISKWDKNTPSINRVKKVAEYFNVSLDYLLSMEDYSQFEKALDKIQELQSKIEYLKKII
ncbi:helix-turn-helix domain-containing protein [Anaerophilus nitritogenes]|uniref:helix-turn-helix domain-containing protein n=1 Tax=Anaerophilus nitritogenes TaxID=2498136 RepID=UPI0013EE28F5|nr:helix-turn-helix transcriptional regulator [Anaerophilus nitritogenes]